MRITVDQSRLNDICQRYGVRALYAFGSVLRSDFSDQSDVDLLVEFENRDFISWDRYFDLKFELEELLGREIDLVDGRGAIGNPIRRKNILRSMLRLHNSRWPAGRTCASGLLRTERNVGRMNARGHQPSMSIDLDRVMPPRPSKGVQPRLSPQRGEAK